MGATYKKWGIQKVGHTGSERYGGRGTDREWNTHDTQGGTHTTHRVAHTEWAIYGAEHTRSRTHEAKHTRGRTHTG